MRIAIVGLGHMGSALAKRLDGDPRVTEITGTRSGGDNRAAVSGRDVVILAVKPQQARAALEGCAPALGSQLLISVCAGITLDDLRTWSGGHRRLVRAMPNTPAVVGEGMTVLAEPADLPEGDLAIARSIFDAVGRTEILDESLFDAVTALSGCGPAYAFTVISALAEGGAALGIPHDLAVRLAVQTMLGSAKLLLARGVDPSVLRAEVATPGGATVAGLAILDASDLPGIFARAIAAAAERSTRLRR
jgi:pyrroline-5-carboxylate reductase